MDLINHYMNMLGRRSNGLAENAGEFVPPDLSTGAITRRKDLARGKYHDIIKIYAGDATELHELLDESIENGGKALDLLRTGKEQDFIERPELLSGLEAIVRTDGSRPSFLVKEGVPDPNSSVREEWGGILIQNAGILKDAIACVGRINKPRSIIGFEGTGFLIAKNIVATNRHVLQRVAEKKDDASWKFGDDVHIDFGHEYNTEYSNRREFKEVIFYGSRPAEGIDHQVLDLVLIELEDTDIVNIPVAIFQIDISGRVPETDERIFTIGYPAQPTSDDYTPSLLEQLFSGLYGLKRIAPGRVIPSVRSSNPWTLAHDATTLGGNSGSVILSLGREMNPMAIHYGGRWKEPSENWGHLLSKTTGEKDARTGATLKEILLDKRVKLKEQ